MYIMILFLFYLFVDSFIITIVNYSHWHYHTRSLFQQALSDADREIEEVISPFSQDFSNPLNTEINIPLRGRGKPQPQHLDIFNFATDPWWVEFVIVYFNVCK